MKRFYVDTSVWLDFALDRSDGVRPLGELAFQFFKKCMRNGWKIVYSDAVIEELEKHLTMEEIRERCFAILEEKKLIQKIVFNKKEVEEAEEISKRERVSFTDALHAVIARNNNATVVSRDRHFGQLSKVVKCFFPEEI